MYLYYLRLAMMNIMRNPVVNLLMALSIALGIGACTTTLTVNYLMSVNPIPHKSDRLFHIRVDSWDPNIVVNGEVFEPPSQITWTDATNINAAKKAFRQTAIASSNGIMESEVEVGKPYIAQIRLAFSDFFPMFETPFLFGSGWTLSDDENREKVIVLSKEANNKVFGGANSVGKTLRLRDELFKVVGVLDDWAPTPKYYDVVGEPFGDPEDVFMPFYLKQEMQLPTGGQLWCWKRPDGNGFEALLMSECVNFQLWIELESPAQKKEYENFLYNYVMEQKELGRFPRPMNNRVDNVMEWMDNQDIVTNDAKIMLGLSFLFLLVCLLNTMGLLFSKFASKSQEVTLRRSMGARKSDLLSQYLVEAACIGCVGGVIGLLVAMLGLETVKGLFGNHAEKLVSLNEVMVAVAIGLSVLCALLASMYPIWKACNVNIASQING